MRSFCVCKSSDCCGKKITCGYVSANDTGLYYLQSRYYNPEIGRFINADAYISTGQGLLGCNMFAYCSNNPIVRLDPSGYASAIADALRTVGLIVSLLDGPSPILDILVATGLILCVIPQRPAKPVRRKVTTRPSFVAPPVSMYRISAQSINWGAGNKNHILRGTGKLHVAGWRRLGIDPDKNGAWNALLPILYEVVEKADDVACHVAKGNTGYVYTYAKVYIDEGVRVVVSIWVSLSGEIQKLSDAIPFILD